MELRKGTELEARYVVHDVVGTGAHASVWRALDKQLNRDVALKRLTRESTTVTEEQMKAAVAEARKNAQLVHPNIVQVYDIITVEDEPLIVMEYVNGDSLWGILRQRARRAEAFPLDQAMAWIKDILAGVAVAHAKSICHRDLSPRNILVTDAGVPKIADFGIARILEGEVVTGHVPDGSPQGGTGNPFFMAPEQARGEPADLSSDLFMIGIVAYLLLTGRHPFADPTGLFTIPELISDETYVPESPKSGAGVSASQQRLFKEYAAIVMRLLHRERAGRYATAQEVIDAIEAVTPSLDCPHCGERVPDHHRFCGYCGKPLNDGAVTPPEPVKAETEEETGDAMAQRGFLLSRSQRWAEAVGVLRAAIKKDPKLQRAYWNLGYALNHIGRHDEAAEVLAKGLELPTVDSDHTAQFLYTLAFAQFNLKKYDDSLANISRALELQPGSPKSLYLRARLFLNLRRFEEAKRDALEVVRLNPEHAGALRLLGELPPLAAA